MIDPSILPLVFVSDFFGLVFVSDGHEKMHFLENAFFLSGENFHAHSAAQCASVEQLNIIPLRTYKQFLRK